MKLRFHCSVAWAIAWAFFAQCALADTQQWSAAKANQWYAQQRWLVGANFIPADAINQLEMWQAETFNPAEIDKELGFAERAGMNTMRVFLHDQLYSQDAEGFKKRIDEFLAIAERHHIKPLLVLFDSCWESYPKLGPQHPPIPGVHNSGWVQSPGLAGLADTAGYPKLKAYVQGVLRAFAHDERVLGWDLWNEPDNVNDADARSPQASQKLGQVATLLPQVFAWAREADPSQPLTSGVWHNDDWSTADKLNEIEKVQIQQSDVITFHGYEWPEVMEKRIRSLQPYGRPLICTEYMARSRGSTFDTSLPLGRKYNVGMINWGLVLGKTQTNLPWESWQRPFTQTQPPVWFHDVFYADGRPYRQAEIDQIRSLTEAAQKEFDAAKKKRR
ncbi:MAG: 1,4-beta-xylanase [Povalibacter sp.]